MTAALRYEWVRVTTVRSTWISLALTFVGVLLLSYLSSSPYYQAFDAAGEPIGEPFVPWFESFAQPLVFAAIFASVVAAQSLGQEYRFGIIRLTLTAFPKRGQILIAKAMLVVLTAVAFTAVSYLASWLALVARGYPTPPDGSTDVDATFLLRGLVYVVLWALSAWALAGLTRQTAIGIAVPIVSGLIVEQILGAVLSDRAPWLAEVLPWSSATRWPGDEPGAGWYGLGVFALWVAVLVALEVVSFLRRDA